MKLSRDQEILQTVIKEAWKDEDIKKELISNPVKAIEKITGENIVLPAGKQLVIRDQTNKEVIYINIPAKTNFDNVELSEEQLEIIAGGNRKPYHYNPITLLVNKEDGQ